MLIQEYGLRHVLGKSLFNISTIILTGLKVVLIIHLILRGIWTGFIGLSYVFPAGVNREKLHESKRDNAYNKPEYYVIKLEKFCSLIFSFVFTSIIFVSGVCIVFIPIAVLYISGLDIIFIKSIILYLILPLIFIGLILMLILAARNKKYEEKMENSLFNNILTTYFTNIGRGKMLIVFLLYFVFIGFLSRPDISSFDFNNEQSTKINPDKKVVQLDKDHYNNFKENGLRTTKAAIDHFWVTDKTLKLFISFYKEDIFTIKNLNESPSSLETIKMDTDSSGISIKTLYQIFIDDHLFTGLKWYNTERDQTDQHGIITSISLELLSKGYHELKIHKVYWTNKKEKIKLIKNWDFIPFEMECKEKF